MEEIDYFLSQYFSLKNPDELNLLKNIVNKIEFKSKRNDYEEELVEMFYQLDFVNYDFYYEKVIIALLKELQIKNNF